MKILTLNTWQERGPWKERWDLILEGLEQYDPDIVAFQEVFNHDWAVKIKKRSGFPFMILGEPASGLMLLSHFQPERTECVTMRTKSPTESYSRYLLFAELNVGDEKISIINTHLSWRIPETDVRQRQSEELLNYISNKVETAAVAVMGDFNAPPDTPEVRQMEAAGFQDAYRSLHADPGLTWNNTNPYAASSSVAMPDRRIDYIFFRNGGKILTALKTVELVYTRPNEANVFPSDHFGVLATFQ